MPSGKSSKRRRQTAKAPPPVRAKGARRQASRRVLIASGALIAAVVIAAVLAVMVGKGSSSSSLGNVPAVGSLAGGLPGAAAVNNLFKGIPQHGTTLGRASAPVTMVEFVDAQCPYCMEFETQVLPSIVRNQVRSGKLRIVMQPWAFIGPDSVRGQAAVLAAAQQNKAFNYAALLYDNQGVENTGWLSDSMVTAVARSIPGLKVHTLLSTRTSGSATAAQQRVDELATRYKVKATPTIFVGRTGTKGTEVPLSSPTDTRSLVSAINAAGS